MQGKSYAVGILAAGALVAGCGGEKLSSDESYEVSGANLAFASTVLDGSMYSETLEGVDYLIELCRKKPDAKYEDVNDNEITMVQVLQDAANTLEEYRPQLAAKLDRVQEADCA